MKRPKRTRQKYKPVEGQQDLLGELPPVLYCRRCRRELFSTRARNRGYGRDCWKKRNDNGSEIE